MLLEMYKVLTPMQRSRLASSRLSSIAVAIALGVCTTTHAQQTGLTDAQIRSANVEVPRLVELLGLQSGMSVADVGAGFGAWTTRLAREVGPSGRITRPMSGRSRLRRCATSRRGSA